jgi:hypothetical protein
MLLGVASLGPMAGLRLGSTLALEMSRLLALGTLPAALLFRARYRAYPVARWVLGAALFMTLPFVISRCFTAFEAHAALGDRAAALLDVAVILAGFFGFMGADTTAGGSVWAALVLGVLSTDIGLRGIGRAGADWLALAGTSVGTACAGTLAALGSYHLLASLLGRDARRNAGKVTPAPSIP